MSNSPANRVAVIGASGKMGRHLVEAVVGSAHLALGAAIERAGSPFVGQDAGELAGIGKVGTVLTDDLSQVIESIDSVIDFSTPENTLNNVMLCAEHKKNLIIGTTGLSDAQDQTLRAQAVKTSVVYAPNMSIGVNLLFKLVQMAAKVIGDQSDIEIIEAHHRNKVDAPSGTALEIGRVIADQLGRDLKAAAVYGREGRTGPRTDHEIGFETIRAGDIIGEHTAMFAAEGERIELTHRASSRKNFAMGAVRACEWVQAQPPGLYDMADVLGL